MNSPGFQIWKSVSQLAVIYPLSPRTLQRYIKEGRFGSDPDHVLNVSGEFFVSTLGDQHFREHHRLKVEPELKARTRGELIRRLKSSDQGGRADMTEEPSQ